MSTTRRIAGTATAAAGLIAALTAPAPAAAAAFAAPVPAAAVQASPPPLLSITLAGIPLIGGSSSQAVQGAAASSAPHPNQWQYLPARRTAAPPAHRARVMHRARRSRRRRRAGTTVTAAAVRPARRQAAARPAFAGQPQAIAQGMLGEYGWSWAQFSCLQPLWGRESGWDATAYNPSSGAYGIPQALPGSKMASAGADWHSDPATQIRWGLSYIREVYGTPCGAWAHEEADGWY